MKKLPIIRHIRALWMLWKVERWAQKWGSLGIGLGQPNSSDLAYIQKVWKGEL